MNLEKLAAKMKEMYEGNPGKKSEMLFVFVFEYGKYLIGEDLKDIYSPKELVEKAGISVAYKTEIFRAYKIYKHYLERDGRFVING